MKGLGLDDKQIWKQIEDIVIKTLIAAEPQMNMASEQYVPHHTNLKN